MYEDARLIIISGCSAGGKSTLLEALAARDYAVAREPGRQVVEAELAQGGDALPWRDPRRFLERCLDITLRAHEEARKRGGITFFDRSLIDTASALIALSPDQQGRLQRLVDTHRYHPEVFMAPPWQALWDKDAEQDNARQHTFDDARREYARLMKDYPAFNYRTVELPHSTVEARAYLVITHLTGGRNA